MTATQAPTPGPLDSESVKLLVKGDWLCDGVCDPWQFSHIENGVVYGLDGYTAMIEPLLLRNAFIGRPDADGWIFNEQGWAENPVPGTTVEYRCRSGSTWALPVSVPSEVLRWGNSGWSGDIIAFRLAPTAPVEASGSERALQDAVDFGVGFLVDGQRVSPERVTVCHGDNSPLRSQPSGETREAVALQLFADEVAKTGVTEDTSGDDAYNALTVIVEYARQLSSERPDSEETDGDINGHLFRNPIQAAEALLSARPLALGGQQGEIECDACKRGEVRHFSTDDGFWVEITTSAGGANEHGLNGWIETLEHYPDGSTKRREYVATDSPALSTTPARAEAQDEGAAGYKAALIDDLRRYYNDCTPPQMHYAQSDGLAFALDTAIRLLSEAHPSPTPAADADRVREAVTIIRDRLRQIWEGDTHLVYSGNPPEPSHDEEGDLAKLANEAVDALNSVFPVPDALAALKSTAAKEGGE